MKGFHLKKDLNIFFCVVKYKNFVEVAATATTSALEVEPQRVFAWLLVGCCKETEEEAAVVL